MTNFTTIVQGCCKEFIPIKLILLKQIPDLRTTTGARCLRHWNRFFGQFARLVIVPITTDDRFIIPACYFSLRICKIGIRTVFLDLCEACVHFLRIQVRKTGKLAREVIHQHINVLIIFIYYSRLSHHFNPPRSPEIK